MPVRWHTADITVWLGEQDTREGEDVVATVAEEVTVTITMDMVITIIMIEIAIDPDLIHDRDLGRDHDPERAVVGPGPEVVAEVGVVLEAVADHAALGAEHDRLDLDRDPDLDRLPGDDPGLNRIARNRELAGRYRSPNNRYRCPNLRPNIWLPL